MNRKLSSLILATLIVAGAALAGCNGESNYEFGKEADLTSSTMVTKFELGANWRILENLDSVFFSIDLVNRQIFNADSLPFGTDVSKLTVSVNTPNSPTLEMIFVSPATGKDTIINITDSPKDSINFAYGTQYLRVTAPNGTSVANYRVKVNVHKVQPDSLMWTSGATGTLPTPISMPAEQSTVRLGDKLMCLAGTSRRVTLSTTADPYDFNSWQSIDVTLPANSIISSLTAADDALYLLTADGALYSTTDPAMASWTEVEPASASWTHLYGEFDGKLVGVRGSEWATWPPSVSGSIASLGSDFPVAQTSQLVTYMSDWAIEPQALMVGGKSADGTLTGAAWGFNGSEWFRLSSTSGVRQLPAADGYTLFPYFTYTAGKNWVYTPRAVWIAIGHEVSADLRSVTSTVYCSQDNGISWIPAPENLQLPKAIGPRYCAQAYVIPHTMTLSRAVKPITEWDTDFIYMFGGLYFDPSDHQTKLRNQLWRGVIERAMFKPLQ